jgi:outer membrane protein assembly factor BamB
MIRLLLPLALVFSTAALHAENWSNWRGPLHNGSSPEKGLPGKFSKTEGVKWAVDLPGSSAATPVIWGDRVFVTAADPKTKQQAAICLDRKTGRQLWRADISAFSTDGQYSNSCSPSPVTDGKLVVFFFGTGELVPRSRSAGKSSGSATSGRSRSSGRSRRARCCTMGGW